MKIAIDEGHNRGQDQGAVAIGNENAMNIQTGEKVIAKLQALGHQVLRVIDNVPQGVDVGTSLADRANAANKWGADLYVSIHANAGGGHGTEVWIGSEKSRGIATKIASNIAVFGYTNRGVKVQGVDGGHLYVLQNTNMPALLVEQCFVDSSSDMANFNAESMANAIVAGITGQAVQETVSAPEKPKPEPAPKYDETIPAGANIFPIPNTKGYIEQAADGRLIIHKDRGNYISIGKGIIQAFWNDNNGHSGSRIISG
jgi:N-acetylmuramoyl-L-alanine amidase